MKSIKIAVVRIFKAILWCFGGLLLVMLVLSFTSIPYTLRHQLGVTEEAFDESPEVIVMLGGDGMPSSDGMLRCYYTAKAALENSEAMVVIAMPAVHPDSSGHIKLFISELVNRGVDEDRIELEWSAVNTHEQGIALAKAYATKRTLLITSTVHAHRAVLVFRKEGFELVEGLATTEGDVANNDLLSNGGDNSAFYHTSIRYNMWSYLIFEIETAREYAAISYYWLRGWI